MTSEIGGRLEGYLPPIYEVVWLDSCSQDAWHNPKHEDYGPLRCVTVGFLLKQDEESVTIAASYESEAQVCGVMTIPMRCVLNMEKMRDEKVQHS